MKNTTYRKPATAIDAREHGRVILAHGEVTGHAHEVVACTSRLGVPAMEYFTEPDTGRRILMVVTDCLLRHQEHAPIALSPTNPIQVRQGDVCLQPLGPGVWHVIRQRESAFQSSRQVAD